MLKLRLADAADCDLFFNWRNDPLAISYSLSKAPVEYQAHVAWYQKVLLARESLLLVGEWSGVPCGQIRFDKKNQELTISYAIDPRFRGQGLSFQFLTLGLVHSRTVFSDTLVCIGVVLVENIASCKAFLRAGFSKSDPMIIQNRECFVFSAR